MRDSHSSEHQNIHYLDPNPGGSPGVLLLHGLGATGESWILQFPTLIEAGFRPIAPDMRGFGKSPYYGKLSIESMAEDCAGLLASLKMDRVHVVGISMGGVIAQQLAVAYTEKVDRLVLVNTFHRLRPKSPFQWGYYAFRYLLLLTVGLEKQAEAVSRRIFPHPHQEELRRVLVREVVQADPRAYRAAMLALARYNNLQRLKVIKAPTLVITGACDTTVDPAIQAQMVELIPGARQIVIPEAGHAVTADQPDEFNHLLIQFLSTTTGKLSSYTPYPFR